MEPDCLHPHYEIGQEVWVGYSKISSLIIMFGGTFPDSRHDSISEPSSDWTSAHLSNSVSDSGNDLETGWFSTSVF